MNDKENILYNLAIEFKKYNNKKINIKTSKKNINIIIKTSNFCHLIGLQYAIKSKRGKNYKSGIKGYEKIIKKEIKYEDIINGVKRNKNIPVSYFDIEERIKYLLYFINNIKKARICKLDTSRIYYKTKLKGNYILFIAKDKKYLIMSLKEINEFNTIIESFFVMNNISLIGALEELEIINIQTFPPF